MRPLFALLLALAAAPLAHGQAVTADDYARAERFLSPAAAPLLSGTAGAPTWLPDGRFWYRANTGDGTYAFWLVDPRTGVRAPAFDAARLATALSATLGRAVDPARLPVTSFSPDGAALFVHLGTQRYRCTAVGVPAAPRARARRAAAPAAPACEAILQAAVVRPSAPEHSSVSPDGSKAVFIRDHNLWLRDLLTGADTPLTADGAEGFGYATDNAGWVHSDDPVVTWSPDSKKLFTFQHDSRGVPKWHMASVRVGQPELDSWAYPLPGDSLIFRIARVVVHLPDGGAPARVVRLQMPPDAHRSTVSDHVNCGGSVCDAQWTDDGQVAFLSSSRDHKQVWFRLANPATGVVRTVFDETSATQVGDASFPENLWRVLPATNEAIWWSQRENWTHLYLYDLATGRVKNAITRGEGNVTQLVKVDAAARVAYVMAQGKEAGRDPYFEHLYRVGLDGTGWTLLTPEDATHRVTLSPDGRTFLDTYSTPDMPPVTVVRELATGRLVQTLERGDVSRLTAAGWKPPVRVTAKGRDGATDLYGLMFTPTRLDPARKYPVVVYIYPGPQVGSVGSRAFSPARGDHQALAELGFVVVALDGMGTPGRSKAFADAYYGRMADNTLPDQIAGLRDLAARYPYLDLDRVGIWGHSGGGYASAAAILRYPDFFDVAVSQAGNHDNRVYEDDWGERYQGLLTRTGDTDSYAAEANQSVAQNLRGRLLLAHGLMDDNVPAANTFLLVDALVKANKDFDLLIFPHARHGFGASNAYMTRRRWDYFVRHLLGTEPPREYPLGQRR